ncbi:chorismate--pyruvate lyase family protein [Vibrio zhanjiangensis]|nr:chorismate lyase [Vibrio zhanjiangensis]
MKMSIINEALVPEVLKYRGSLTRVLKSACSNFNIQALSQSKQSPFYMREVLLCDGEAPLVWAKSYLSSNDVATVQAFLQLQGKSLGEQLLFTEGSVSRGDYQFISYRRLRSGSRIQNDFCEGIGRVSKFSWQEHPTTLMLLEVFRYDALNVLEEIKLSK